MNYATWEPDEGTGRGFSPLGENTRVGEVLVYVASDDTQEDLQEA